MASFGDASKEEEEEEKDMEQSPQLESEWQDHFTVSELADIATLRSRLEDMDVDGTLAKTFLSEVTTVYCLADS
jgi:hypothetical protein